MSAPCGRRTDPPTSPPRSGTPASSATSTDAQRHNLAGYTGTTIRDVKIHGRNRSIPTGAFLSTSDQSIHRARAWLAANLPPPVTTRDTRRMKVCNVNACPELFDGPGGRCPTHRREARARRVTNRVYSTKAHRTFRDAVLTRDPICTTPGCNQWSTVADHYPRTRRELEELGLNPNDPQYGRGLCAKHHNAHTAQTSPGGWAAHIFE